MLIFYFAKLTINLWLISIKKTKHYKSAKKTVFIDLSMRHNDTLCVFGWSINGFLGQFIML